MSESSTLSPQSPDASQAPPVQAPPPPPGGGQSPRRRPWWKRLLFTAGVLLFLASVVANLYLLFLLSLFMGAELETSVLRPGRSDQVVAVWRIDGMIGDRQADMVRKFCRKVRTDPNVKAVVIRVESGGGAIAPCDQIYQSLKQLRESGKKLVVSMGGVAASGGYYVSLPGEAIYAEPTTLTGSIGVIMAFPVVKGTMDKYGVRMVVIRSKKTEAWKAAPNWVEEPADYQLAEVRKILDKMQEQFESVVRAERGNKLKLTKGLRTYTGADGSKFTVEETEPFNGKVFLADGAKTLGLVDSVGYLQDAILEAQQSAGLSNPKVVAYARRESLFEGMLGLVGVRRPGFTLDLRMLEEIRTPRIMMVWQLGQ